MRRTHALVNAIAAIAAITAGATFATMASAESSGTISGTVFDDANRNGVRDAGEAPFPGRALQLVRADGTWVAGGVTDADGRYTLSGVSDGTYQLRMIRSDWVELRSNFVPTTTGSLAYQRAVSVPTSAPADLGLRAIVRSHILGEPISSTVTANGTRVESYNDAVSATEVAAALAEGGLVGAEAPFTTVRLDYQDRSFCASSYAGAPGSYSAYSAKVWLDWVSWVDTGDQVLFHEYGHAWAEYHEHLVQQDGTFASYLNARGLTSDVRVGTNVYWDPREMIAEDYRQLFGSQAARAHSQANQDIPPAALVPGLQEFLSTAFMQPSGGETPGGAEPVPTQATYSPLSVSDLTMNPSPMISAGTASLSLSDPASITVRVLSPSGQVVRTLVQGSEQLSGTVAIVWDRRTDSGRKAKAGTYLLVVDATDATGHSVHASATFSVEDERRGGRR